MKVQFEFSASDLVEVASRTTGRSRLVRSWRWESRATSVVIFDLLVYSFTPGNPLGRALFTAVACVVLIVLVLIFWRRSISSARMLKYYREQLGGDGPFVCEVEISPEGLVARQLGAEIKHDWSQVASVAEVAGGIEFIYRPIGGLLVRDRAFPSPEARQEFLDLARRFVPPSPEA